MRPFVKEIEKQILSAMKTAEIINRETVIGYAGLLILIDSRGKVKAHDENHQRTFKGIESIIKEIAGKSV